MSEQCTWCGTAVGDDDGFRVAEPDAERRAVFCRLEHVVPWVMQGAFWEPGLPVQPPPPGIDLAACAECGAELDDARIVLVRHRGEHRVGDAFCGADHLMRWARAGGRYR
jgi:hypothetical protein